MEVLRVNSSGSSSQFCFDSSLKCNGDDPFDDDESTLADTTAQLSAEPINIQIYVPDFNLQKCLLAAQDDSVWSFKQRLLSLLPKELPEFFNYGLFLPPCNGRAGKFLQEHRPFAHYSFRDCVPYLELKYKKRVYKMLSLDEKHLRQLHSKNNLRKLIDFVIQRQVEKVESLCSEGLDPNFHDQRGETPLTLAGAIPDSKRLIMVLVAGGAHLDFRNLRGETVLHCAARLSCCKNVETLLELGASPDWRDANNLTPLYHCVSCSDSAPETADLLLRDYAPVGTADQHGNQEVHQACKQGLPHHLEHLLFYGADISARNNSGNTPLHVCAVNNRIDCARLLLFRGAQSDVLNLQGQSAYHLAAVTGQQQMVLLLRQHDPNQSVPYRGAPRYNSKRRRLTWTHRHLLSRTRSVSGSSSIDEQLQPYGSLPRRVTRSLAPSPSPSLSQMDATQTLPPDIRYALRSAMRQQQCPPQNCNVSSRRSMSTDCPPSAVINSNGYCALPFTGPSPVRKISPEYVPQYRRGSCGDDVNIPRILVIPRGPKGFGFILRGAKRLEPGVQFEPCLEIPALQYFEGVDMAGMAMKAGLRPGDFLLEIDGVDVRCASHEQVVRLIQSSGEHISLKVITVDPDRMCNGSVAPEGSGHYQQSSMLQNGYGTLPVRKKPAPLPPRRLASTTLSAASRLSSAFAHSVVDGLTDLDEALADYDDDGHSLGAVERSSFVGDGGKGNNAHLSQTRVASVRNRITARRTSMIEIEHMLAAKQQNAANAAVAASESSFVNNSSDVKTKVYNSVSEMKRRQQRKDSLTSINGGASTSSMLANGHPSSNALKSFSSSPNLQNHLHQHQQHSADDVDCKRQSQVSFACASNDEAYDWPRSNGRTASEMHQKAAVTASNSNSSPTYAPSAMVLRPKTPPPPPPPLLKAQSVNNAAAPKGPPPPPGPPPPMMSKSNDFRPSNSGSDYAAVRQLPGDGKADCRGISAEALSAVKLKSTAHSQRQQQPPANCDIRSNSDADSSACSQSSSKPLSDFENDLRSAIARRRNQLESSTEPNRSKTVAAKKPQSDSCYSSNSGAHVIFSGGESSTTASIVVVDSDRPQRTGFSLKESVRNSFAERNEQILSSAQKTGGSVNRCNGVGADNHDSSVVSTVVVNGSPASPSTGLNKKDSGYTSSRNSLEPSECGDLEQNLHAPSDFSAPPPARLLTMNVGGVSVLSQQIEDRIMVTTINNCGGGKNSCVSDGRVTLNNKSPLRFDSANNQQRQSDAISVTSTLSTLSGCSEAMSDMSSGCGGGGARKSLPLPVLPSNEQLVDSGTGDSESEDVTPNISQLNLADGHGVLPPGFSGKPLLQWSSVDVGDWLDSLYLSEYRRTFLQAGISGRDLLKFDRSQFTRIGVTRIAHRITIENSLRQHRPPASTTDF